nr:hypothetical protein [Marinicella sp. W31]MDC2879638.1 hypothetical protein [Marinicella sp. W31]
MQRRKTDHRGANGGDDVGRAEPMMLVAGQGDEHKCEDGQKQERCCYRRTGARSKED